MLHNFENSTKPSIIFLSLKVKCSKKRRIVYNPYVLSMCRGSLTFQWHTKCRGWTISLHRVALSTNASRSHCTPKSRHSEKSGLRSNVVGQQDRKQRSQQNEAFISIYGSTICRLLESIQVCSVLLGEREGQQRSEWLSAASPAWVNVQYLLVSLDLTQHL